MLFLCEIQSQHETQSDQETFKKLAVLLVGKQVWFIEK